MAGVHTWSWSERLAASDSLGYGGDKFRCVEETRAVVPQSGAPGWLGSLQLSKEARCELVVTY